MLIVSGVIGSIAWSFYLKKTTNYKLTIRAIPGISMVVLVLICIALNVDAPTAIVMCLGGLIGASITPILPVSYDLGCELSFPVGEAQVTGILNGGAMILTFFMTLIISSAVKFGTRKKSLVAFIIYAVLIGVGTVMYFLVKIDLRRRNAEQDGHTLKIHEDMTDV